MLKINRESIVGKKYNDFKVIKYIGDRWKCNEPHYLCKCICGNEQVVSYGGLVHNEQINCKKCKMGNKSPRWKGFGEISSVVWNKFIRGAQKKYKKLEFSITIEEGWEIFLKQKRKCALTGIPLNFPFKDSEMSSSNASLDRIDSTKGYIKGNVQWIDKTINRLKLNFPNDFFIEVCNLVAKTNFRKNIDLDNYNNISKLLRNPFNANRISGENNHRSKTFKLENREGKIITITGIREFCKKNNIGVNALRHTKKRHHFIKQGWRIIEEL